MGHAVNAAYLYHPPCCDDHGVQMRLEYLDGVKETKFQKKISYATYRPSLL